MHDPIRVAIVCTHVIQHFPPLFRGVARNEEIALRVFYGSSAGLRAYSDPDFGATIAWDSDLTSGYDHEFLPSAPQQVHDGFWGMRGTGLVERLDAFKPDLVFVFGYTPAVMIRAALYARRRRIPVAMITDSELLHERSALTRASKRVVLPLLLSRYDAFLTVGDNNEAYLRHYGVDSRKMIRGGIPTDESAFLEARKARASLRAAFRASHNIADDDFVMLCVGKFIRRKRPGDLLAAAGRINDAKRRLVVVYAGNGELRPDLEAAARAIPHVETRFLGFVNQSGLAATYAGADILIHAAEIDAHPLTITEATMVGVPVVVSNRVGAVGPTDTAQPGRNARVYDVGDIQALADIIRELSGDTAPLAQMHEATWAVAQATGLTACVAGFVRLAHQCADEPRRAG